MTVFVTGLMTVQERGWLTTVVTGTFDATTGQLVLFEDGSEVASGAAQPIAGASTTLLIATSGSGASAFVGSVDNVRVWNVARSASDIQGDYAQVASTNNVGLVAEWNFTEDQGTTVADSSGNEAKNSSENTCGNGGRQSTVWFGMRPWLL